MSEKTRYTDEFLGKPKVVSNVLPAPEDLMYPRIAIIRKSELTEEQITYLRGRVNAPEHLLDMGPQTGWETPPYDSGTFIVVHIKSQQPIGVLYRDGPKDQTHVAWWLDKEFRNKRYGSEMVDLFARVLKEEGVTAIAKIPIVTGEYYHASVALVRRLKKHFNQDVGKFASR